MRLGLRRARRILDESAPWNTRRRLASIEAALAESVQELESRVVEARIHTDATAEAVFLAEASRLIRKEARVTLVEAEADYGNLWALGNALAAEIGSRAVAVIARDDRSASRWRSRDVEAHAWTTAPGVGAAPIWSLALSSAVSVHEHHPWWRDPDRLVLRGLLAGSARIQLWHGNPQPYGKEVALGAAPRAQGMYEFADLVTTSVGYRCLVSEPRAREKRLREFEFAHHVPDIDFRMVAPLSRAASGRDSAKPRILLAPTFPEGERGARLLAGRLDAYRAAASSLGADVHVRHHAWTPTWVAAMAAGLPEVGREVDVYDVIDSFDVLVTDFSSLAADALLLGRRVVLDHTDGEAYAASRGLVVDPAMLECCDVVDNATEAVSLAAAPSTDVRHQERATHRAERLAAVGSSPGRNTVDAIVSLLREVT